MEEPLKANKIIERNMVSEKLTMLMIDLLKEVNENEQSAKLVKHVRQSFWGFQNQ